MISDVEILFFMRDITSVNRL